MKSSYFHGAGRYLISGAKIVLDRSSGLVYSVHKPNRRLPNYPEKAMHTRTSCVVTIIILLSVGAKAQDPKLAESSWIDLTEQPSRKELFDNVIKASLEEDNRHPTPPSPTSFAIPKDFFFPEDARFDKILNKPRDKAIFGIDICHHDGKNLNLSLLRLQKVDFVYAKA